MNKLFLGAGLIACCLSNEALAQTSKKTTANSPQSPQASTPAKSASGVSASAPKADDKPKDDTPDIYDVKLNGNWDFSSLVIFDNGDILLPLKYLPSDLLGNITEQHFIDKDNARYMKIEASKIVKKDTENLSLEINLSEEYFKSQNIAVNQDKRKQSQAIDAIYTNYDINMSNELFKSTRGTFAVNYASKHNWTFDNQLFWDGSQLQRLSTTWQKEFANNSTLIIGDTSGTTINGFNSVNFFGIRYATSYFNTSQFLANSLPTLPLSGFAVNPSKLDLYINNQLVQQSEIASGKYNLNIPYQTRGLGVVSAVVYDITGKPVTVTVPFYSSSDIIRKGDNEYDVSLGAIRSNIGTSSFDYSDPIVNALYKGGWFNNYTQDAFVEASRIYSAGSLLGHWVPVPWFGMVNLGVSLNSEKQELYRLGYERVTSAMSGGFDFQKSQQPGGFCLGFGQICLKQQVQVYYGSTLPWHMGSLNANYVRRSSNAGVANIASVQWNKQITKNISLFTNYTNVTGTTHSNSVYVGLSINFNHHLYTNSALTMDSSGLGEQQSIYRGEDDAHPEYGYGSVTLNRTSGDTSENVYYGAHLSKFAYQVNLYKDNMGTTGNVDVSGSAVYIPSANYFAFTKEIQSGLAFVNVDGLTTPIQIMHENRFAGYTDSQGRMVIPDAVALNNEKVAIDINKLSHGLTLDYYQKEFYVPFSGAVEVDFKAKPLPYTVVIKGAKAGSIFYIGKDAYVVGDDGVTDVDKSGQAVLPMENGNTCTLDISPKQKEYQCK
jgi:outer membrane usher protein FimD/PapC